MELRNEDTVPIEARITAHFKTHKQNLEAYKQSFAEAVRQEYPLGEVSRSRLHQMRQQLALSAADVALIEARITTEVETYQRNLQQYEQAFVAATQQEYPLSEIRRNELRQHQSNLGLSDVEIAPIEATVTTQRETYHQKSQQYEEAFASATQRKYQPSEATRTQLRQTWQTLGLNEADVKAIEAPILAQIETYQANLRRYEQEFADATEQEYPLNQAKRSELRQRQQALVLSDEDIAPIENRITASIEDRLKKFQQYEQVFLDSIQFEFPVSEATREELKRFQHVLELGDEELAQLEEKVISQRQPSAFPKVPDQPTVQLSKATLERSTPPTSIASNSPVRTASASVLEPPSPTNRPDQTPASVVLARQQFRKWAIPVGVGIVGLTVASQFLGYQPPQSSTPSTPSSSTTTEVFPSAESKVAQCNKIRAVVDKSVTEINLLQKIDPKADQKTRLAAASQLATKLDDYAGELQVIELKDEKLKDFQRNSIKIYRDFGKALRDVVSAAEKNDDNAIKTAVKNLQNFQTQPYTQLEDDVNKYCQGK